MSKPIELPSEASFQAFITAIECSMIIVPAVAAGALAQVRNGVITGEGPTTRGRIHFSRTIDTRDASLCERILIAAGGDGEPVTRAEAEVLIEIDAAAAERADHGRFDDLLVKAIAHHVLASAGHSVPPRAVALAPETPLTDWAPANPKDVDTRVLEWIASNARGRRRKGSLMTLAVFLAGAAATSMVQTLAAVGDTLA
jgi:hypothetical protein